MRCPNCNVEIPDVAKFCPKCGVSLEYKNKTKHKPIDPASKSLYINISPEIKVEGGGRVKFSPVVSLSYQINVDEDNKIVNEIKELKKEFRKLYDTNLNLEQLGDSYSKEDSVILIEAFKTLLKIKKMAERRCYVWELQEQLDILDKHLNFDPKLLEVLREEIQKIAAASIDMSEPIPENLVWRVNRAIDRTLDIWVARFLKR